MKTTRNQCIKLIILQTGDRRWGPSLVAYRKWTFAKVNSRASLSIFTDINQLLQPRARGATWRNRKSRFPNGILAQNVRLWSSNDMSNYGIKCGIESTGSGIYIRSVARLRDISSAILDDVIWRQMWFRRCPKKKNCSRHCVCWWPGTARC